MITARGTRSEIIEKIQAKNPLFMEVLPLTLEEIFISETEVGAANPSCRTMLNLSNTVTERSTSNVLLKVNCVLLRELISTSYLPIWVKFIFLGITMNKIITSMSIFSKLFVNFAAESSTASLKISIYWSSPVFI